MFKKFPCSLLQVNFFEQILLFKAEKFDLMHRVATICGKERELYVRAQRLEGVARATKRHVKSEYNGGIISDLPDRPDPNGKNAGKIGQENFNDPEVERNTYAKYTSIELEDEQLEESGYIMEMECRQQWESLANSVDTTHLSLGDYESQIRASLVQEIGNGEICSICTSMITNEFLPDPPTQISTSGWDKGQASSSFAFCNGLDTSSRKLLCKNLVPFLMAVAHKETGGDGRHINPDWQMRDSLQSLFDSSPLFTQYKYSVEHNEIDPTTKEPFALTSANGICHYLMSCEKR